MWIAMKELLRQPGRFTAVGGALTLLVVLLVVLGGFLDGLELSQTGPFRAHEGRLLVFADDSDLQIERSQVPTGTAPDLADLADVAAVGTLDQLPTTAGLAGREDLQDVVVFGYEVATDVLPEPPGAGGAVVDAALADRIDLSVGDTLEVGPDARPVTVAALVDDLTQGSPTIWLDPTDWRAMAQSAQPGAVPPEGTTRALVLGLADGADADAVAREASEVGGVTAVTPAQAIDALAVVQQQSSTFAGIIGVTFAVTLLVVALFFALLTLERVGLYAVLKALGGRTSDLVLGVSAQAVGVTLGALLGGVALSVAFVAVLPPELPVRLEPGRLVQIGVGTLLTALLGSLFTLRRILRIDPAEAIG